MGEKSIPDITDSEWIVMKAIWSKHPITAEEIITKVLDESKTTIRTVKSLLHRLTVKKAVGYNIDEKNSKKYHYFPLVTKKECVRKRSKKFISLIYENKPENLLTDYLQDVNLSEDDVSALEQILLDLKENTK